MTLELLQRLEDLERKLHNICLLGTIAQADYAKARVRVSMGDLTTAWLPWLTQRASNDVTWDAPEIGEQVMVISPSGELSNGIVFPALYQQQHPANGANPDKHTRTYKDGAVIEYDRAAHHLKAILPAGSSTELISDTIHFKGLLTLDGDFIHNGNETKNGNTTQTGNIISSAAIASVSMTASGAISGASVKAGAIDLAAHTHGGVATGLGNTGAAK